LFLHTILIHSPFSNLYPFTLDVILHVGQSHTQHYDRILEPTRPSRGAQGNSFRSYHIQSHDSTLLSQAEQQCQTNQQLEQVTAMLQLSLNKTPTQPLEAAAASSEIQRLPFICDVISPSPEKYSVN
ncbi:hypothetical protein XENORESO_012574, partial [Xenotaenia resolanae]